MNLRLQQRVHAVCAGAVEIEAISPLRNQPDRLDQLAKQLLRFHVAGHGDFPGCFGPAPLEGDAGHPP